MMLNSKEVWASISAMAISALFLISSYWQTDAEVYLFPRIIAIVMLLLAVIQTIGCIRSGSGGNSGSGRLNSGSVNFPWRGMLPGLILSFVLVLVIETIGFYTGSLFAFVGIVMLYGKNEMLAVRPLLTKIIVGLIFMSVLYALFWKLLYVRTPTGWLF